jgi:hypothetical protein
VRAPDDQVHAFALCGRDDQLGRLAGFDQGLDVFPGRLAAVAQGGDAAARFFGGSLQALRKA